MKNIKNKTPKTNNVEIKPDNKQEKPVIIVGIGASAGGLESFEEFFRNLTSNSGIAFILVSHLDPDLCKHACRDLAAMY